MVRQYPSGSFRRPGSPAPVKYVEVDLVEIEKRILAHYAEYIAGDIIKGQTNDT